MIHPTTTSWPNPAENTPRSVEPEEPLQAVCACAALRMASRSATQFYDLVLQPSGLKTTQFIALASIDRAGEVAQSEFAREHAVAIETLSRRFAALRRKGPPYQLTPGALLRATLVTSGTMTNRVDRLAAAGLVHREPDPQDRRGVLVTLTPSGRARVDAALADLVKHEQALLNGLSPADRATLAGLLRVLLAPLDA